MHKRGGKCTPEFMKTRSSGDAQERAVREALVNRHGDVTQDVADVGGLHKVTQQRLERLLWLFLTGLHCGNTW